MVRAVRQLKDLRTHFTIFETEAFAWNFTITHLVSIQVPWDSTGIFKQKPSETNTRVKDEVSITN